MAKLLHWPENLEKKLRETGDKAMQNTSPAYDSRSKGHGENRVRILQEKVRRSVCHAREHHMIHSLVRQICGSNNQQFHIVNPTYGRSRVPHRCVPWSEKVSYLEQTKRKVPGEAKWHEGIFLGIKDESEVAVVGTPHGRVFARNIRRV